MLQRIVIDVNWLRNTNNYAKLCRSCASNETQLIHFGFWRWERKIWRTVVGEESRTSSIHSGSGCWRQLQKKFERNFSFSSWNRFWQFWGALVTKQKNYGSLRLSKNLPMQGSRVDWSINEYNGMVLYFLAKSIHITLGPNQAAKLRLVLTEN